MNYKNALVALAATLTLGVSPALTSVNASTNAKETTKTTKKAETKKATKKTSKKATKSMPKVTSTYWQQPRYIEVTKNTKALENKLVTKNNQKYLTLTKKTLNIKKGDKAFVYRSSGATTWTYLVIGANNQVTYYTVSSKDALNSNSWFKLSSTTSSTTNNSNNNTNTTQNNKTVVTVKSNYQTAQNDTFTSTDYANGFVSPSSKTFTSNGITITAGEKYQVKLVNNGSSQSPSYSYQFQVGNNTVTAPMSNDLFVTNINVFPVSSSSSSSSTNTYASEYTPDSSDAVVSKSFTVADGTKWYTLDNFGSNATPKSVYVYNASQSSWVKYNVVNNQLTPAYQ